MQLVAMSTLIGSVGDLTLDRVLVPVAAEYLVLVAVMLVKLPFLQMMY